MRHSVGEMPRTVDVIAEVLKREGIDRIFGIPGGGSTTDLIDPMRDCRTSLGARQVSLTL
jgi:thiamine pyrophosphate-dependent acetolactate synthase large subunit-like protein